jgi:hypothetical protein
MSWAYWGIVTGLAALVAMVLVCIDMAYSDANESDRTATQTAGGPADVNKQVSVAGRHAA